MSGILKTIANRLSRYPGIKRGAKFIYQASAFVLNFHRNRYMGRFEIERISTDEGGFFGYYDKSPESPDGQYVIFHAFRTNSDKSPCNRVSIVLKHLVTGECRDIYETTAFNLQIGARLQWIDNSSFVFNVYDQGENAYRALIYSVHTNSFHKVPHAIYDIRNGKYISVNFCNLTQVGSEYGYPCDNQDALNRNPEIIAGNLNESGIEVLVRLDDLKRLAPHAFENTTSHHFNHLMFSPDGGRFIFIFRWTASTGRKEFLVMQDMNTGKLTILNSEMTSHCCWMNENSILGYMSHIGKPAYYVIDVESGRFSQFNMDLVLGDGHPTYKNGLVLVDSYPDASRMQHLRIISQGRALLVGSFFSPLSYNEKNRCDLHPRFNAKGDAIYVDSMHQSGRHLYRIKLKNNE